MSKNFWLNEFESRKDETVKIDLQLIIGLPDTMILKKHILDKYFVADYYMVGSRIKDTLMVKAYPGPLPVIHAILICDRIIDENKTHKKSLIGIFDTFFSTRIPALIPELSVYVNLSDVVKNYKIKLELVCLDTSEVLAKIENIVQPKTQHNWEMGFSFRNLRVKKEGTYVFRFWVDYDVVGEKYFFVRRLK